MVHHIQMGGNDVGVVQTGMSADRFGGAPMARTGGYAQRQEPLPRSMWQLVIAPVSCKREVVY
jgi:hypothetical protein